ncbi:uncharacterized protein LOC110019883 [Phalaenopsis equestris]|uniref:uncharacterized protein LOC110019883 n=1 Tax=Phalaenopsis equestris TaxID=78828 RepID=UPI0009E30753|nr:uncharacterized protein LOC110019883 [Phalaenopsis equestris]
MRSFSKLGLTLLLVFPLSSILCLAVTLVYSIRRRRRQKQPPLAGDAELGCKVATFKTVAVLSTLCCTTQSRVEPAMDSPVLCSSGSRRGNIPAAGEAKDECSPAMWGAVVLGPSRVLYTIKEEEREGLEVEEKEEEEDFFGTPCESPEFYTPASSPVREAENEADVAVCVSPASESGFGIS